MTWSPDFGKCGRESTRAGEEEALKREKRGARESDRREVDKYNPATQDARPRLIRTRAGFDRPEKLAERPTEKATCTTERPEWRRGSSSIVFGQRAHRVWRDWGAQASVKFFQRTRLSTADETTPKCQFQLRALVATWLCPPPTSPAFVTQPPLKHTAEPFPFPALLLSIQRGGWAVRVRPEIGRAHV